jgi:hypothetical protein
MFVSYLVLFFATVREGLESAGLHEGEILREKNCR